MSLGRAGWVEGAYSQFEIRAGGGGVYTWGWGSYAPARQFACGCLRSAVFLVLEARGQAHVGRASALSISGPSSQLYGVSARFQFLRRGA